MTTIIGVNHLMTDQRFTMHFSYPYITREMISYLNDSHVGLELLPPNIREPLNERFWKNNPDNILSIYNPEAHRYFEDLEKICGKVTYLESESKFNRLVEIDEKYREFSREINSLEYQDITNIDTKKISSTLIDHWKLYLEAIKIEVDRDEILLGNVLLNDLDVAVVGMGHAYSWMNKGMYPFEFLGEDTFNDVPLSHLNNSASKFANKEFKYYNLVEKWQAQIVTKFRNKQPDYIGVFEPFMPSTYFEIFLDEKSNKNSADCILRGECLDMYGHSVIEIRKIKSDFIMNKKYDYHTHGASIAFEYSGIMDGGKIIGFIQQHKPVMHTHGSFIMIENSGNALDNIVKLYDDTQVLDRIKDMIQLGELNVPHGEFPADVGNDKPSYRNLSSNVGFTDIESLNHSNENDDLPF